MIIEISKVTEPTVSITVQCDQMSILPEALCEPLLNALKVVTYFKDEEVMGYSLNELDCHIFLFDKDRKTIFCIKKEHKPYLIKALTKHLNL